MSEPSPVLQALYRGDPEGAERIAADLTRPLDPWEAAALGDLDRLGELLAVAPGLAREYADDGFTVLHLAAFFGGADATRAALDAGADANAESRNDTRVRPLHSAVARSDREVARQLLDAGAEVDAKQSGGFTALHAAAMNGDEQLVDMLLNHGATLEEEASDGRTAADFAAGAGHEGLAARLRV
jgi:uncharacterized protein